MVTVSTAPPATQFGDARLPNGVRLHYAQQGPRTGPAVLMLHGYTDSWFSFSRVLPLMPRDLRLIVPDQRGHGDSDRPAFAKASADKPAFPNSSAGAPESDYGMDGFAEDAVQLMDALQVPKAVVIGHSMGSFVARRVAALAPSRVHRLVLLSAAAQANNASLMALRQAVDELTDPVDPAFVREFQLSTVHRPVTSAFLEAAIANSRRMPASVWKAVLDHLMHDLPPGAPPQCPTLVLGGRQDAIFPAIEQTMLARQIPQAALELVDGIGHALHWEDPERFVAALQRFGI